MSESFRASTGLQAHRRTLFDALTLPQVPILYLYGELTSARTFVTVEEIKELLPDARVQCLSGQRHMAQAFAPEDFAQAILNFTASIDRTS